MDIFFDESGFTGYNLLDPAQPYFVIGSSAISPGAAEEMMRRSFPNYRAAEFKFSNILNSANQAGLRQLGDLLFQNINDIFLFTVDKRFAVFAKMVDFLLEPTISAAGYDFYAEGFCRKYANYIHFGLTYVSQIDVYNELLTSYMLFSRSPSVGALQTLQATLHELEAAIMDEGVKPFLAQMAEGAAMITHHFDLETFRQTNDIHLTTMVAIVCDWRQRFTEDFHVFHDASSHFLRQRDTWNTITDQTVPRQLHPLGDGSFVEYPLRVLSTTSVDSAQNFAIQLCDLIAGFATAFSRLQHAGEMAHPIVQIAQESGFGQLNFKGMQPGLEFPDFPPRLASGPDAVDLMTRIILSRVR